MLPESPTLHMLCGKIASGKSTMAAHLGATPGTVLIAEDAWLDALFADELHSLKDYVQCSSKLRRVIGPHVVALLDAGMSVVLDFPANTVAQRAWMKEMLAARSVHDQLLDAGWRVATVWECALRRPEETALAANLLAAWLRSSAAEIQIGNADVIADENAG